jgi:ABC-2 type transport system permease protein
MNGAFLLFKHTLKRTRTLLLSMGGLLALFQIVMIMVARSLQQNGSFELLANMLPPFVRQLLGSSLVSFMSFAGIVCVGYFHLTVIGGLVSLAIVLATIPASEIETGFLDLLLARPIARQWIVTRTIAAIFFATVLILTGMLASTLIGLKTIAPRTVAWPSVNLIVSLAVNLAALTLSWGGAAMAIGCASQRRSVAAGSAGLLALTTFLLDYVGRLWRPAESIAWLSPFRYYDPLSLVMGSPLPPKDLVVLLGIAAAGFAAAYVLFARRDLSH